MRMIVNNITYNPKQAEASSQGTNMRFPVTDAAVVILRRHHEWETPAVSQGMKNISNAGSVRDHFLAPLDKFFEAVAIA